RRENTRDTYGDSGGEDGAPTDRLPLHATPAPRYCAMQPEPKALRRRQQSQPACLRRSISSSRNSSAGLRKAYSFILTRFAKAQVKTKPEKCGFVSMPIRQPGLLTNPGDAGASADGASPRGDGANGDGASPNGGGASDDDASALRW